MSGAIVSGAIVSRPVAHLWREAYGGDSDVLDAKPGEVGHHSDGLHEVVVVIERLSHPHEDDLVRVRVRVRVRIRVRVRVRVRVWVRLWVRVSSPSAAPSRLVDQPRGSAVRPPPFA